MRLHTQMLLVLCATQLKAFINANADQHLGGCSEEMRLEGNLSECFLHSAHWMLGL